jgi:hypothetical protein
VNRSKLCSDQTLANADPVEKVLEVNVKRGEQLEKAGKNNRNKERERERELGAKNPT